MNRHGQVTPQPRKRPRSSWIRFQAEQPNGCWQSDFTHYRLASGHDIEIISWIDDCSRYALHISAHRRITAAISAATFTQAADKYGYPASTLTDNGMVYTVRFATGRGGRTPLEELLAEHHIIQKNSRPNHPTTCGKVERFQQTMKKWLAAQPDQPTTIAELDTLLHTFVEVYNHHRGHRSLPHHATPATVYTTTPKASPDPTQPGRPHDRVRLDHVDTQGVVTLRHAGRLHHIGIGRTYKGTCIKLLIQDLDITIINATTGEILRELTLDPHKDYQPIDPKKKKPEPSQ
ncbi:transposase [Tessaracoccus sp. MC1865]|uniref:DDE-type integrase/transposase/recombinase n=1 Tax=Tessaracoccus sp. MC1865 TaxID=2760310 RepID=UPI001AEA4A7D|nr:DDE-type integrase/transposase/recombinase [Tessaracoccus sp. MC1865]QTO38510.1 transposase [Tessaracoccus sp. MC1865]